MPHILPQMTSPPVAAAAVPANDGGATRAVLLLRPRDEFGPFWLGLTIRGGVEHGLGHFVSAVETGSEAERCGVLAGDEILRVDGMALRGATHREAVSLIASR